ncbi:MFS transporter [Agrobacterium salinitolerans]|uniref:MFS transporter n=1 Tax=Agrobacterium salinitolerans TaxID=1183413 RepID=A0A9X3KP25_9HYPH|nr:MFS transporter [Agrobacterium salinitolerans]MCZ7938418.1 MFS transporter [Agrobacterium salinitolerans]
MAMPLLVRNRNYRLLLTAGTLTNLGDGVIVLALPWLATLMSRDPLAIAAVAAAGSMPWLLFALPSGVIIDRTDRRKLIARADMIRAGIVIAIMMLALSEPVAGAVWLLAGLAFLLGSAEVMRDNAAQTILPSIVAPADLEVANGQMWSAEQLMGQFIGPPLAGVLIGLGIAVPFGLDAAALVLAAGMVWLITLPPQLTNSARFWPALVEGINWMRKDRLLFRLAVTLGMVNFLFSMATTIIILFSQEILGLSAAEHGFLLSVAAAGAVAGSLGAPLITRRIGAQAALYLSFLTWGMAYAAIGFSSAAWVVGAAIALFMAASMLWNVITVSWRQRRIPAELLGRVNSIYRFFGWGSMPLGAIAAGILVSLIENEAGREMAIRGPFVLAAVGYLILLVYARLKLRLQ